MILKSRKQNFDSSDNRMCEDNLSESCAYSSSEIQIFNVDFK